LAARTIFVGDVHGCAAELQDLLNAVGLTSSDRVVLVGDLVARGPDTRGVLRLVRELKASTVRGNHEERMIAAHAARKGGGSGPRLGSSHTELLQILDDEDWAQLEALPLHLDLPEHGIRVVHAGVVPGVAWEAQDPWMVTHIRSISADGAPTEKWGRSWAEGYRDAPHIVFGHNAQSLPQLHPNATGIDTACVYGGNLTALVLPANAAPPDVAERAAALVSVPARQRYKDYGRSLPGN